MEDVFVPELAVENGCPQRLRAYRAASIFVSGCGYVVVAYDRATSLIGARTRVLRLEEAQVACARFLNTDFLTQCRVLALTFASVFSLEG